MNLRPVKPGDDMLIRCTGGVVRRKVPERGFLLEGPEGDVLVPFAEVQAAVEAMSKGKRK